MLELFSWTRRAILLALTGLSVGMAWAQQPSLAQVERLSERMLASMAGDDARLELAVSNVYGRDLAPEKRAVAKAMMRSMLSDKRMHRYIAQVIAPVLSPTLTLKEGQAYVLEGIAALQRRGMVRLPTERKAQFLQHVVDMTAAIPAETCKAMLLGKLDLPAARDWEARHTGSLTLGAFEAVTALYQQAMQAELDGYPDVKTINPTQAKAAERAYEHALDVRIRRLPAGLTDRVLRNVEAAEPSEACQWFREAAFAVLDLTEPYRGWYLTRFTESMQ
jgi:hypothetical protein